MLLSMKTTSKTDNFKVTPLVFKRNIHTKERRMLTEGDWKLKTKRLQERLEEDLRIRDCRLEQDYRLKDGKKLKTKD